MPSTLKDVSPKGPRENRNDSHDDDEEDSFFTVLDEGSYAPRDLAVRVGRSPGEVIRNLLVVIFILPAKNPFQALPLDSLLVRDVVETEHEQGCGEQVDVVGKHAE